MAHLLVVEDDPQLRGALVRALRDKGHAVATAPSGMAGLDAAVTSRPDLVVLDLGLPDVDGAQVLRMLRAVSDVPVIVATARDDEPEMVAVLEDGADDYIVKPFGAAQLDARVKAVLRRLGAAGAEEPLRVGALTVDTASREVTLDGAAVDLTPREFDLLAHLARRPGQVVSRRELLAEVWQQPLGGADKTVDVHLSWLRRKLGETAQSPRYLHTVRTVGVKLTAPATTPPDIAAADTTPADTPLPHTTAADTTPPTTTAPHTAPTDTTPPVTTATDTATPHPTPPDIAAADTTAADTAQSATTTPANTTPPTTTAPHTAPTDTTPPATTTPHTATHLTPPDIAAADTTPADTAQSATTTPANTTPHTTPTNNTPPTTTATDTATPHPTPPNIAAADTAAPRPVPPDGG